MNTTRPELRGSYGMVASTHWLATGTAMSVLERGGNAFDAAAAAGFVLQVVEPHENGLGGDLPIIVYPAQRGQVLVVNGQGPAPAAATTTRFRDLGLDLVPGTGFLGACVPGAFDAWMVLLRDFGTWPIRAILEYAVWYAAHGFPVSTLMAERIRDVEQLFRSDWPTSAELYLSDGVPSAGSMFRNPELAHTYQRIVDEAEAAGPDRVDEIEAARHAFYEGFVAEAIVEYSSRTSVMDASGECHSGLLSGDDLAGWRASVEPALGRPYHEYEVFKTGPWGQGPVFLQQLALLEGTDLGSLPLNGTEYIHLVAEAAKLAFADREAWYGDPNFVDVPIGALLSREYTEARRALMTPSASLDLRPGSPAGRSPQLAQTDDWLAPAGLLNGNGTRCGSRASQSGADAHHGDTTNVSVADRFGNLVSCMPSGGWLQSSPRIPGLGFCLGTRAQMFWLEDGLPNSLEPRKRPRTTLSPTIALRDGAPYLAFGSPGGDAQDQWALTFFLAHVHHGLSLQAAIDAPTYFSEHFPSSFYPREAHPGRLRLEGRIASDVAAGLRERGHLVVVDGEWSMGYMCAVGIHGDGDLMAGASARDGLGFAVGR